MGLTRENNLVEAFLANVDEVYPREIAGCLGVELGPTGTVILPADGKLGALVGGCVLIAVVMDTVSCAAAGIKWSQTKSSEWSKAMREFVQRYMPSPYHQINWYKEFRCPLVHSVCPGKGLQLMHQEETRPRHLKLCCSPDVRRRSIHVFALFEDLARALRAFSADARQNNELYDSIASYLTDTGVMEVYNARP